MTDDRPFTCPNGPGGGTHSTRVLPSEAVVHIWTPDEPAVAMVQLQHGYAEYSERFFHQYSQLVPSLLGRGIEVWAMDLLGHGRSPGRRAVVDVRLAVADHVAVRRDMLARLLPLLVLGHSLGGLITAGSVTADATGISGAILLAPALPPALPAPVRTLLSAVARILPAAPAPLPAAPASELTRRQDVVRQAQQDPLMAHRRLPLLVGASSLDVAATVWAGAPQWQTPCLVVHGTSDTSTDRRPATASRDS
ncbi:lysophospholipase [Streptomyces sp. NBC_00234]|uniref:alpha/beta fold hydrolase n=1 Tax=Streptomyces sp. NBC_00234 TaxID=2903638 RepID=UPI002E2CEB83|nr:alpha/beta fold hydrolase [Streptomyces sp. NBC_00234]